MPVLPFLDFCFSLLKWVFVDTVGCGQRDHSVVAALSVVAIAADNFGGDHAVQYSTVGNVKCYALLVLC